MVADGVAALKGREAIKEQLAVRDVYVLSGGLCMVLCGLCMVLCGLCMVLCGLCMVLCGFVCFLLLLKEEN